MSRLTDQQVDTLVAAAMTGVRQIQNRLHDRTGGHCAFGVLHLALHAGDETAAAQCAGDGLPCDTTFRRQYLDDYEIARANDALGWDFLTIARKFGA